MDCIGEESRHHSVVLGIHLSNAIREELRNLLEESLQNRLFISRVEDCQISSGTSYFRVEIKLSAKTPLPVVRSIIPRLECSVTEEGTIYDPVRTVRYGKMIYDEFEKTRLFESIQDLIEKMEQYIS